MTTPLCFFQLNDLVKYNDQFDVLINRFENLKKAFNDSPGEEKLENLEKSVYAYFISNQKTFINNISYYLENLNPNFLITFLCKQKDYELGLYVFEKMVDLKLVPNCQSALIFLYSYALRTANIQGQTSCNRYLRFTYESLRDAYFLATHQWKSDLSWLADLIHYSLEMELKNPIYASLELLCLTLSIENFHQLHEIANLDKLINYAIEAFLSFDKEDAKTGLSYILKKREKYEKVKDKFLLTFNVGDRIQFLIFLSKIEYSKPLLLDLINYWKLALDPLVRKILVEFLIRDNAGEEKFNWMEVVRGLGIESSALELLKEYIHKVPKDEYPEIFKLLTSSLDRSEKLFVINCLIELNILHLLPNNLDLSSFLIFESDEIYSGYIHINDLQFPQALLELRAPDYSLNIFQSFSAQAVKTLLIYLARPEYPEASTDLLIEMYRLAKRIKAYSFIDRFEKGIPDKATILILLEHAEGDYLEKIKSIMLHNWSAKDLDAIVTKYPEIFKTIYLENHVKTSILFFERIASALANCEAVSLAYDCLENGAFLRLLALSPLLRKLSFVENEEIYPEIVMAGYMQIEDLTVSNTTWEHLETYAKWALRKLTLNRIKIDAWERSPTPKLPFVNTLHALYVRSYPVLHDPNAKALLDRGAWARLTSSSPVKKIEIGGYLNEYVFSLIQKNLPLLESFKGRFDVILSSLSDLNYYCPHIKDLTIELNSYNANECIYKLGGFRDLRSLTINYVTDSDVRYIVRQFPMLEILKVSSIKLTKASYKYLRELNNLKELEIWAVPDFLNQIYKLINALPSLKKIRVKWVSSKLEEVSLLNQLRARGIEINLEKINE